MCATAGGMHTWVDGLTDSSPILPASRIAVFLSGLVRPRRLSVFSPRMQVADLYVLEYRHLDGVAAGGDPLDLSELHV
jgi:hypothetical protein